MKLEATKESYLYEQIADDLSRQILGGMLVRGDKIPSVGVFAACIK